MLLAADIGNTHIVLGCMEKGEARFKARLSTDKLRTEYEYAAQIRELLSLGGMDAAGIEGTAIASVSPALTETLRRALVIVTGTEPVIVGAGVKTGLNLRLENPAECGADLVAAAVGALKRFTPPLIIIDMGTATTLSAIDKSGSFIGGAIVTGVGVSLEALAERTALLPNISLEAPKSAIGRGTVESMRSGAILGTASMLDGMIDRMSAELGGGVTVVATGGLAKSVVSHCTNRIELSDDLILEGLAAIYERNAKK